MNHARITIGQLIGTATSGLSAIASWQTHIDWALRVAASITAIAVGICTLITFFRRKG